MYDGSKIGPQQIIEFIQNLGFASTLKLSRGDTATVEALKCVIDIQGMKCQSCEGVVMYDGNKIE